VCLQDVAHQVDADHASTTAHACQRVGLHKEEQHINAVVREQTPL
jgi:hypothetical protein